MKPAEFDYVRVASVAEACQALADVADGAEHRIIAGGQTLVPLMAMRLAQPTLLIDINDVDELRGIAVDASWLSIKACTRQRRVELSPEVAAAVPLLVRALSFVGHTQTRNRGTVGGSIAGADPSAEIPLVATALEAEIVARDTAGERIFTAAEFFQSAMMTALEPDQCLTEIRFPLWNRDGKVGIGFHEMANRKGDFAIVAAAAQLALDGDGICRRAAVAVGGAAPTAVKLDAVEDALLGTRLDEATVHDAAAAAAASLDPSSDLHASAEYRRRVACVLVGRAIGDASRDAAAKRATA